MAKLVFVLYFLLSFSNCIKFAPPVTTKLQVKENEDADFLFNYILDDNEVVTEILFGYYEKTSSDKTPVNKIIAIKTGSNDIEVNPAANARYKDSNILFTVDNDSQAWFKLKSVSEVLDSESTFYCQISLSNGNKIEKKILLEVIYDPNIRSVPLSPQIIKENSQLALLCTGIGKPIPIITWYKDDVVVYKGEKPGEANLVYNNVNRTYAGNYTCEAENDAGSVISIVEVYVQFAPVIDLNLSSTQLGTFVGNYKPIYLVCQADGIPTPTYKWNNPQNYQIQSGEANTFVLQQPKSVDFGRYICEASNDAGFKQHYITVNEIRKPHRVNITIFSVEARMAKINILEIDKGDSVIKALTLSYQVIGEDTLSKPTTQQLDENESIIEVEDLKPYTTYMINITVTNEFFVSDGQMEMIETKQDVPGPPSTVAMIILSSKSINVTWQAPVEPNGNIIEYEVKFYNKLATPEVNATTIRIPSSRMYYNFTGLTPYTMYITQVRAYTNVGPGQWSLFIQRRTDPDAPGVPRNVDVKIVDFHTGIVSWKAPVKSGVSVITKYAIKVEYTSLEEKKFYNTTLILNPDVQGRKYRIESFIPYATYKLSVAEGGGEKPIWGNYSKPFEFAMPEGEPTPVRNLVLLEKAHDRLYLRWSRPKPVNGVLRKFTIGYKIGKETARQKELVSQLNNVTFYYTLSGLQPQTDYQVFVFAHTAFHESPMGVMIKTATIPIPPELLRQEEDASNTAAILAGCVTVVVVVIIAVVVFIYMSRRKRLKHSPSMSSMSGFLRLATRDSSPAHVVDGPRANGSVNGYIPNEYAKNAACTFTPQKPIEVGKLKEYVLQHQINKDRGFIDEFRSIKPEGDFTYEVSALPENKCKNRYANILAYDHSRVVLNTVENLEESDYINANYIDGYNKKAKFIATQGPVSAAFSDFWRMVWEQNCNTIVMVTNLIEKSRAKCQKYWPNESEKRQTYGKISVEIVDEMELADYVVRRFRVSSSKNGSSSYRKVTHYQFLSWPDHGVPQYATPLLQFVKRIRSLSTDVTGPVICHCSAGVGRSGTYIVLDGMLDQIEHEKLVDVFGFVTHIRSQRNLMVQTEPQYVFLYNALLESVLCGNTEVNTCDLPARIKHLNSLNPASSTTYMQEEYERLDLNMSTVGHHHESAMLACNKTKNRFPEKLPYETSRVKLWPYPNIDGSDYINGNFVDGYQQREAYILTQAPLENTIQDFWRMIWEYEVLSVVMISSNKERDMHHCYPYWPENNEATLFGLLRVQIAAEEERTGYIKRDFRVTNSKNGETRIVTHFMYFDWVIDCAPDCTKIIDMIGSLQKTQQQTGNNSVIIHCSDGCGRSGALAALMYCLERLKLEGMLDVFQTIRTMRTQRTSIVQSMEQYQFIYKAVRNFLDCFSNYANFK